MEINFIQMAASAGHAVAYTIRLIFKYIHEYYPLKRKLSLACPRNTTFDGTPEIIAQRCQIAAPIRPSDIRHRV